jgi:two-component SAPR family response regulator
MHAVSAGDESACAEHLRRAFAAAAERRLYNQPWWSAREMAQLYAKALAHGADTDYVISAIRRRGLAAPDGEPIEGWPWPFRIYTLGGFRVLKDDEALRFAGKSPRKPLELLKALIAFGGIEVNQSSLIDALWSDLEGDNAQRAFETALYRLRKLLADDGAVVLKSGKLTLDAGRVWVDTVRIEHLFQDIDRGLADAASETAVLDGLASRLLAAYRGHFLAEESEAWAIARRERLYSRFLNALQGLARCFEAREAWDAAARCYRRALEIEPLLENLWYRLMLCHKHLEQTAEALAVYRRCCQALSSALGIAPSEQTQALAGALSVPTPNRDPSSKIIGNR